MIARPHGSIRVPLRAACRTLFPERYPPPQPSAKFSLKPLVWVAMAVGLIRPAAAVEWQKDIAVLFYDEPGRVRAVEPVYGLKGDFGDDRWLNLKIALDSLTGASPNGIPPAARPQTISSASGSTQAAAHELPVDTNFKDTRIAFNAHWQQPVNENTIAGVGITFSTEYDYRSTGLNLTIDRAFNKNNTTLSLGVATSYDTIFPHAGIPRPLTYGGGTFSQPSPTDPNERKVVSDLLLSLSQVISANILWAITYGVTRANGYLTDPYKLVGVFYSTGQPEGGANACIGQPLPSSFLQGKAAGDPVVYCYEKRPSDRLQQSIYTGWKQYFTGDVWDIAYRYTHNDWGMDTHMIDTRYAWRLSRNWFVRPHLRYYQQSAAHFYRIGLAYGDPIPHDASGDNRLAKMTAVTTGLEIGQREASGRQWHIALEIYRQNWPHPPGAIGVQNNIDLIPDLQSLMLRFGMTLVDKH